MADILTSFINWGLGLVDSLGYMGIFLISFIGNAVILLPVPAYAVVIIAGGILNPWLVGIFAGLGAAIGELTGYGVGRGGGYMIEKKYKSLLKNTKRWSERHGMFPIVILFAATPLPDDIVGIICGVINYDIRKFLGANIIGKIVSHSVLAWAGFYGSSLLGEWNMILFIIASFVFAIIVIKMVTADAKKPKAKTRSKRKKK